MSERNASASAFGWDFQANSAILLMLENIKDAKRVRVEGADEDIEITLQDRSKVYAQAKAFVKPDNASHVIDKLTKALETLRDDAKNDKSDHDFGKNIIPTYLENKLKLQAYRFKGYWKDVGTIDSLWEANMDLLKNNSGLDLFDTDWKIYTDDTSETPQVIGSKAKIDNAFITQGVVVNGSVSHSVIFSGVEVGEDAKVTDSVIMNNVEIGKGAKLTRCLVADDVKIPDGIRLGKKTSKEILLVSKAYLSKVGESHE